MRWMRIFANGNVCIWDANTGEEVLKLLDRGAGDFIDSICFSPAGNFFLPQVLMCRGPVVV